MSATLFLAWSLLFSVQLDDFDSRSEWKTLDQPEYSISYPEDWSLDQSGTMGMSFAILSPMEGAGDTFRENVNLLMQDVSQNNLDLDSYTSLSIDQIGTYITDSKILSSERIKKDGGEYQQIVYTGKQGLFYLKFEQRYWVINGKAYVLTLTTEQDKFEAFKATGTKVLDSFQIK
jgi:hypothetical protein